MDIKTIKIADIKPAAYNPRKQLKPGDKEYEALKSSIERWSLVEPLVVNVRTGNLVSGHQRYSVLVDLGYKEAEAVIVDYDDHKEKLLNIAMNRVEGQWDYSKLEMLFAEFDIDDIFVTGFNEGEVHTLFSRDTEDMEQTKQELGGDDGDPDGSSDNDEADATEESGPDFTVYLSFPSRESAEKWLEAEGIARSFKGSRSIVIRMEGTEYADTGN